ncbi:glutamate--tRNA ligase [Rhodotorula toruloides]
MDLRGISVPVKIVAGEGKPAEGQVESKVVPKHKKNPEVGDKTTFYADTIYVEQADAASFAQDEELTLMDWGNAFVRTISRSSDSGPVISLEMELNLAGDFKKTKKKVTWLASPKAPSSPEDLTLVSLLDYDYLITKKKLEEDDNVEDLINPKTEYRRGRDPRTVAAPLAHPRFRRAIIQFERKGFYIVDRAFDASNPSQKVELILIPKGRASSVAPKHQAPAAPAKDASKAAKTPSKGQAGCGEGEEGRRGDLASGTCARRGCRGCSQRATARVAVTFLSRTKMYKVDSPHGHEAYETPTTTTSMYGLEHVNE